MSTEQQSEPNLNPGSNEAVKRGCICAILDNGRGDEELGRIRGFYITQGCPLHDKSQETTHETKSI